MLKQRIASATVTAALAFGAGVAYGQTGDWVRSISGSAANGWTVRWGDGTVTHTPTLSEDMAECSEYSRRYERAACKAALRVEHRWLGITKRSLAHHR